MPKRPIVASDIDGTLFRRLTIELLTKGLIDAGVFPKRLRKPFMELSYVQRDREIGYPEYSARLLEIYLGGIKGASVQDVDRVARKIANERVRYVYAFTKRFLEAHADTHQRVAITGANDHIMKYFAPAWEFDACYPTVLEVVHGRYTGHEVSLPVADKARALLDHVALGGTTLEGSAGIGDTSSDIPMLELVTHPIAFNPDFALLSTALANHWLVVHEKKDTISVRLGHTEHDFHRGDVDAAVQLAISLRNRTRR